VSSFFYEKRQENVYVGDIYDRPFPQHVHDVVEIVCITSGRVEMSIAGKLVEVLPGDIAVVFPLVPHSYESFSPDTKGLTLIFTPNTIAEFTYQFRSMVLAEPVLRADEKDAELNGVIANIMRLSLEKNRHLRLGYLHMFLAHLLPCLQLSVQEKHMQAGLSAQVLNYIAEHFTESISLEIIARAFGISRTHISHLFSQQLKINFCQYINTLRIDYACFLLKDPSYAISQIVYLCGYSNPRTFHRAFMANCKMTPKQFRASLAEQEA